MYAIRSYYETDAGTAGLSRQSVIHPVKIVENLLECMTGNPGAMIGNRYLYTAGVLICLNGDLFILRRLAKFDAVFYQT